MFDKFTNLIIFSFLKWLARAQITQASECHPNCHNSENFRFMVIFFQSLTHHVFLFIVTLLFFLVGPFLFFFSSFPLTLFIMFLAIFFSCCKVHDFCEEALSEDPNKCAVVGGLRYKERKFKYHKRTKKCCKYV